MHIYACINMNETQLLLWPVLILALKKKQINNKKKKDKRMSLKKSQNMIMGKFGKSNGERQQTEVM